MTVALAAQPSKFDECVLVTQTDRYTCPKCKLILADAVQSIGCGHRLCQGCVDGNGITKCPVLECDQQEQWSGYFPDLFVRREIFGLDVICPCKTKGCCWRGKLGLLEEHVRVCEFNPIVCQYCGATVHEGHVNMCSFNCEICEYCGERVPMFEADEHKDICQYPLLENHSQKSESPAPSLGSDSVQSFNQGLVTVQPFVCPFPDYHLTSGPSMPAAANICSEELQRLIQCIKQLLESIAEFQLSAVSTMPLQGHTVFGCNSPPIPVVSQSEAAALSTETLERRAESLEDQRDVLERDGHDNGFTWKVDRFYERMKEAQSNKFIATNSPVFYSGPQGYKMFLRVYLNGDGDGMGSHVSIFLVIMKGEFDSVLQWPFKRKVTIQLINQKHEAKDIVEALFPNRRRSFKKPRSVMNIGCGCPRFISHHELHAHGFIADDTIIIRCQVDSSSVCTP